MALLPLSPHGVHVVGLMLAIPPYTVFFCHYRRECLWGLSPLHPVTQRCTWPAARAKWSWSDSCLAIPPCSVSSITIGGSVCGCSVLAIRLHGTASGLPLWPRGYDGLMLNHSLLYSVLLSLGGSICGGSVIAIWLHGAASGLPLGPRGHGWTHASHSLLSCVLLSL
jgi:hypothetical protein